jgi:hypothetical protein
MAACPDVRHRGYEMADWRVFGSSGGLLMTASYSRNGLASYRALKHPLMRTTSCYHGLDRRSNADSEPAASVAQGEHLAAAES